MPAVFDPKATTIPVLRYLVALADHGHFGRAAKACAVSQPTLSAQLARWEQRMGITAFERGGSAVKPTVLGERVVQAARRALAALEQVEVAAVPGKPPFFGPVKIGIIQSLGPYLTPRLGPVMERHFPDLEWPLIEGLTAGLVGELLNRDLDLVILALGVDLPAGLETIAVCDEPFIAAVPARSPLATKKQVAVGDLAKERLLLLDDGHCLREHVLEACRLRRDRVAGADYRAASLETLRALVAQGRGVTLLPALATVGVPEDPRLRLVPLAGKAQRALGLAWRKGDDRAEGFRRIGALIAEAVEDVCRIRR